MKDKMELAPFASKAHGKQNDSPMFVREAYRSLAKYPSIRTLYPQKPNPKKLSRYTGAGGYLGGFMGPSGRIALGDWCWPLLFVSRWLQLG